MRILAIRARNLASIERFDLELSSGPLAETRIFAITGPTGAGKSTLLDAMCLALYDRAPRLVGSNKSTGREQEISSVDPRSLVRRGSTEASAEVDFETDSAGNWRAIWEVRRAHKRIDGKLQNQRMRLVALADGREHTGGTKTETLEKIASLIGLGYGEFRRAVLLAQNDFASFLRAKPDERAELLEKMTGTELYAVISRNAFLRAKKEEETLRMLDSERQRISPLDEGERQILLQQREKVQAERTALEAEIALWVRAIEWQNEHARAEKELREAEAQLSSARAVRENIDPLAEQLSRTKQAERVRPAFEAAERVTKSLAELQAAEREAVKKAVSAAKKRETAERQRVESEEALRRIAEKALALKPELEAARALDVQLAEAARVLEDSSKEKLRAEKAAAAATRLHSAVEAAIRELQQAEAEANKQSAAMARVEKMAAQWPRWRAEIDRYLALETPAPKEDLEQVTHTYTRAIEDDAAARRAVNEAKRGLDEKRRADPPRAVFEAIERLGVELSSLSRMADLANETKAGEKERAEQEKSARDSLELSRQLSPEVAQLEGKFQALELAEKRDSLLEPNVPCPLCGATDHPAASEPAADRTELTHLLVSKRNTLQRAVESAALAKDRLAQLAQQVSRAGVEWNDKRRAIEMLWVDSPILGRLGANRVALRIPTQPEAKTAVKDIQAAAKTLEEHRRTLMKSTAEDDAAVAALEQARSLSERTEARAEELKLKLRAKEIVELLREPLSSWTGWEKQLQKDAGALAEQLAREVAAWEALAQERARLAEALRARAIERERTSVEQKNAAEAVSRAAANHLELSARRSEILSARTAILNGEPAAQLEARLLAERTAAESSSLSARTAAIAAGETATKSEADRISLAARAAEETMQAAAAQERLSKEMAAAKIDELEVLVALLARGPRWVEETERAIAEARDAVGRAESTLAERTRKLAEHRARRPEVEDTLLPNAAERLRALRSELEKKLDRGSQLTGLLTEDERARGELARLETESAAQRAIVDRWAEMNQLIGSADGKKLRTFAQGLTLDSLLLQANLHLQELRPRYRLRRLEGTDLDLEVVDGDMGEEIRAISTLSGGESFLVSLALALALSSIAAHDVHIRSLFIDEGFGSLDPEAMEVALATLDRLQAEGRTIAIISHVPQIAERIGYRVHVQPVAPGRSEVSVMSS